MFTPHLYDHKFDIDDLIVALCGSHHTGIWQLNSRSGQVQAVTHTTAAPDGSDQHHIHHLQPLPPSFLEELTHHPKRKNLTPADLHRLDNFLTHCHDLHLCPAFFNDGTAGGWLRERIKEEALEWLDLRGLIPPSMRHAWKTQNQAPASTPGQPLSNIKVMIE